MAVPEPLVEYHYARRILRYIPTTHRIRYNRLGGFPRQGRSGGLIGEPLGEETTPRDAPTFDRIAGQRDSRPLG